MLFGSDVLTPCDVVRQSIPEAGAVSLEFAAGKIGHFATDKSMFESCSSIPLVDPMAPRAAAGIVAPIFARVVPGQQGSKNVVHGRNEIDFGHCFFCLWLVVLRLGALPSCPPELVGE